MTTLNRAIIKDRETTTEFGFSYIVFAVDGNEYTLQACVGDSGEIDKSDDGMQEGCCADANEAAFNEFGLEECMAYFYDETNAVVVDE